MQFDASQEKNPFVIDESTMEMTWLLNQDRLLTEGMGGLFPERTHLAGIQSILDVSCGPGGWVLEVARMYPDIEVVGFDISEPMIEYAQAHAQARGLDNAHFQVMDALKPFAFSDASFDLVNARTLSGFMNPQTWPVLMQEMYRVCRPGGVLRLTEFELPVTNSPAFELVSSLTVRAFQKAQRNFSPDERHFGITPMLRLLLRNAGCQNIQYKAHAVDFSAQTQLHMDGYQDFLIVYQLIQPFLVKMQVTTQEEIERIYQDMLTEMHGDDFAALWFYITVWGEKSA